MTIILKIDNCDSLPDGGPLEYRANRTGFDIGREQHLDWTLPDPNRLISGRHCEIRYDQGGYWLNDVSRNGTFVNGSHQRVKSPYRLADGDRLQIGHYVVTVRVEDANGMAREADMAPPPPAAAGPDSLWDSEAPAPPPISRRDLMPPERRGRRAADFSEQYLALPEFRDAPAAEPFAATPDFPFGPPGPAAQRPARAPEMPPAAAPLLDRDEPFAGRPAPDVPRPEPRRGTGDDAVLARLAKGAGLAPHVLAERDPGEVAEEIGAVLRILVQELAQLLKARAAAKVLAKSNNRTMIGAIDNNPLKFVPQPEEVLEIMFARRRAGYLDARRSIEESFRDLKTHELATYAAMQKALARLLEDLSPEAIEGKVSSSAFSSRKARAWEAFVAAWEAKSEPYENGMLDVFLAYFADAYEKATRSAKG